MIFNVGADKMSKTVINGYELISDFRNDNSGFSRWAFARKDGIEFFIKEFLTPVYPDDKVNLAPHLVKSRIELCEEFYNSKRKLYDALDKCDTGNIVCISDFFLDTTKYYIVTEKIQGDMLSIEDIADMSLEQKHLMCKIIIHCVNTLHNNGIVHGDIKHENILFKKTLKGKYAAKIIDFDASFFEKEPPDPDEEFHGDTVYFAPESFLYIAEEVDTINCKIDVFALGLLFHQYFTGHLPYFDTEKYDYPFESVLDGNQLSSDKDIPIEYAKIFDQMLAEDPDNRPSLNDVFKQFSLIKNVNGISEKNSDHTIYEENFGFHRAGDL